MHDSPTCPRCGAVDDEPHVGCYDELLEPDEAEPVDEFLARTSAS